MSKEVILKDLLDNKNDTTVVNLFVRGRRVASDLCVTVKRNYEDATVNDWEYDGLRDILTVDINIKEDK